MSLFKARLEEYKNQKISRSKGLVNHIPFDHVCPRLSYALPGLERGRMYSVTAPTSVGKTKFTIWLFVYEMYKWVEKNPKANIDFKCLYFQLEGTKRDFIDRITCLKLADDHGIFADPLYLRSHKSELKREHLQLIEDMQPWMDRFYEKVFVIDDEYNPTGIYKVSRDRFLSNWSKKVKQTKGDTTWIQYVQPAKQFVLLIVDHINLMTAEKGMTRHETLAKWVSHYCLRHIVKNWKWSVVNVIQQSADSERQQFTRTGDNITAKVEPSIAGMGNNKEVARDHDFIIGLFNPRRYQISHHQKYNINKMQEYYRSAIILKNRMGLDFARLDFFFEGASGMMKEMPRGEDEAQREKWYQKVEKLVEAKRKKQ